MKPLKGCKKCGGSGEYLDRYEYIGNKCVPMYEPCPCLDRIEPPISLEDHAKMRQVGESTECMCDAYARLVLSQAEEINSLKMEINVLKYEVEILRAEVFDPDEPILL